MSASLERSPEAFLVLTESSADATKRNGIPRKHPCILMPCIALHPRAARTDGPSLSAKRAHWTYRPAETGRRPHRAADATTIGRAEPTARSDTAATTVGDRPRAGRCLPSGKPHTDSGTTRRFVARNVISHVASEPGPARLAGTSRQKINNKDSTGGNNG